MKQLEVQIMGQSYLLGSPEDGEAQLRDAVDKVDAAMCKIRDAGKVKARDRIAVLAALNLAFDLVQRETSPDSPEWLAPVLPQPGLAPAALDEIDAASVKLLLEKLDRALAGDGHLL